MHRSEHHHQSRPQRYRWERYWRDVHYKVSISLGVMFALAPLWNSASSCSPEVIERNPLIYHRAVQNRWVPTDRSTQIIETISREGWIEKKVTSTCSELAVHISTLYTCYGEARWQPRVHNLYNGLWSDNRNSLIDLVVLIHETFSFYTRIWLHPHIDIFN